MSYASDFDGIEDTQLAPKRAPFLSPGHWVLRVERLERVISQRQRGVRYWLATFYVVSGPDGTVGTERAWMVKLEDPTLYLKEIKSFLLALLNDTKVSITSATVEHLIGPDQPATGNLVQVDAVERDTQKGGKWTRLDWAPFDSPTPF